MNPNLSSVDNFLDEPVVSAVGIDQEAEQIPVKIIELEAGELDPRVKLLSHSSRNSLHKCPRKYQLYRLSSTTVRMVEQAEVEQGVTFAYGSAVGVGMQSTLEGKSEAQVIIDTFLEWDVDLDDANTRQNKSYYLAQFAVQKFYSMYTTGFLDDYELVYYKGKPAVELSFIVTLPDGFAYRGFVDAVLQHKETKEIMVLEAKTTSSTAQPAQYKNSGQALGYSVILDILFPKLSAYTVLYLVYESKSYEYKQLPFKKSLLQRAIWLQELLIDTQLIKLYEGYGMYPLHGESCYDFFRDCEYLSLCQLTTANLTKPLTQTIVDEIEESALSYDFTVDFNDLVAAQIAKGEDV